MPRGWLLDVNSNQAGDAVVLWLKTETGSIDRRVVPYAPPLFVAGPPSAWTTSAGPSSTIPSWRRWTSWPCARASSSRRSAAPGALRRAEPARPPAEGRGPDRRLGRVPGLHAARRRPHRPPAVGVNRGFRANLATSGSSWGIPSGDGILVWWRGHVVGRSPRLAAMTAHADSPNCEDSGRAGHAAIASGSGPLGGTAMGALGAGRERDFGSIPLAKDCPIRTPML
jgi:hypothetical protein